MAALDKKLLTVDIQSVLENNVTASMVHQIMADIGEKLLHYDVQRLPDGDDGQDENEQLIQLYLDAKSIAGLADSTIKQYRYELRRTCKDMNVSARKITVFHLRQYIMSEMNRGISKNTLKGRAQTWSSFFGWLHQENIIQINPMANLGAIKAKPDERIPFTAEEVQMIKEACRTPRETAMVHFLLSSGCRITEACSINRNDIDYQNLRLTVTGKGSKPRVVYIDNVTAMMLKRYMKSRKDIDPALFAGRGGVRLKRGGAEKMLGKVGDRAGVPGVFPHRFRHTFATNMLDRGMSIQEVSALLGHSKLETTMTYITMNQRNTENNYRRFACM